MKTYFAEPMVEVVKFSVEDVITESAPEEDLDDLIYPCAGIEI